MSKGSVGDVRQTELQLFATNSAKMLIVQGKVKQFFDRLGYEVEPSGSGFRGVCPVCKDSFIYVGLDGRIHPIYWKCFRNGCAGKNGFRANLLGLVKALVLDQNLGTAIKTIAAFLGYDGRPFAITNQKASKPAEPCPQPPGPPEDYKPPVPVRRPAWAPPSYRPQEFYRETEPVEDDQRFEPAVAQPEQPAPAAKPKSKLQAMMDSFRKGRLAEDGQRPKPEEDDPPPF